MITGHLLPCRSGEIGRHAWFRTMWGKPRGGSSPLSGTIFIDAVTGRFSGPFLIGASNFILHQDRKLSSPAPALDTHLEFKL